MTDMESDNRIRSRNNSDEHPFVPSWIISKLEVDKSDIFCTKSVWSMIINDRTPAFLSKKGTLGFPNSCMSWFHYCFERNIFTLDTSYAIGRMNNVLAESQSFLSFLECCIDIDCENKAQIKSSIKKIAHSHLINYELVNNYGIFADAAINAFKTCVGESFDILTTLSFVRFFSLLLRYTLLVSTSIFESTVGKFRRLTQSFRNLFSPLLIYNQRKSRRSVFVVSEPPSNTNANTTENSGFGRSISTPISFIYRQDSNDHSHNGRGNKSGNHSLPFFNSLVSNHNSSQCHSSNSSSRRTASRIAATRSTFSHNGGDDNILSHSSPVTSYHRMHLPAANTATYDPTTTPTSIRKTCKEANMYLFQDYLEKGGDRSSSSSETSVHTVNNTLDSLRDGDANNLVRPYADSRTMQEEDAGNGGNNNNSDIGQNKEEENGHDNWKGRGRRSRSRTNSSAVGGNIRISRRGSSMIIDDVTATGSGKEWFGDSKDEDEDEEEAAAAVSHVDGTTGRSHSSSPDTVTVTANDRNKPIFWRRRFSSEVNINTPGCQGSGSGQYLTTIFRYHSPISSGKENGSLHDRDRHPLPPASHIPTSGAGAGATRSMVASWHGHTPTTTTAASHSHSPPHRPEPRHKQSRQTNESVGRGGCVDRTSLVEGDGDVVVRGRRARTYTGGSSSSGYTGTAMGTSSSLVSSKRLSRQPTPPNHLFRYDKYFGEKD